MGACKLFIFGGCQGNENNFETMEECIQECSSGLDFEEENRAAVARTVEATTEGEPKVKNTALEGEKFKVYSSNSDDLERK